MTDGTPQPKTLTAKQQAFVAAYIGEAKFNATKAARIAGYSDKATRQAGSELLSNPDIAARVSEELKARSLSADGVIAELTDIATADWREFVTVRTDPRSGETLDVKMDLSNKVKSLEILAKAHGLLTENVNLSGNLTTAVALVGVDPEDV